MCLNIAANSNISKLSSPNNLLWFLNLAILSLGAILNNNPLFPDFKSIV